MIGKFLLGLFVCVASLGLDIAGITVGHALAQQQSDRVFTPIEGAPSSRPSSAFGSGWIDLEPTKRFPKGTVLKIEFGADNEARRVLIRLLQRYGTVDRPEILLCDKGNRLLNGHPCVFTVPPNNGIRVTVDKDCLATWQISVHGGRQAFGIPLGDDNGTATLAAVFEEVAGTKPGMRESYPNSK